MPKLFHVVFKDRTVTFTSHEEMGDFLANYSVIDLPDEAILCESDVTGREYDLICKWRNEV